MSFRRLSPELVIAIHDAILNPGELQGLALDKSMDGALARVENRLAYGMIGDAFDLAAAYAEVVSQGHCFNDGKKRTAYEVLVVCLELNGHTTRWQPEDIGQTIITLAQGRMSAPDLAAWLRTRV